MKIIDLEVTDNKIRFYLGNDDLQEWWGDDWNDIPYEHNAGTVYLRFVIETEDVAIDFQDTVIEPCDCQMNSPYSKDDFRYRKVPCLIVIKKGDYPEKFSKFDTYQDFICYEKSIKIYFGDNIQDTLEKLGIAKNCEKQCLTPMEQLNIEIKAKCQNHDKVREILVSNNADFKGIDYQTDTYFKVNFGRLKLREGDIENHLIFYDRENVLSPKQSNVILFDYDQGSSLKEILSKSLGELVTVKKKREIFFINNIKFHLDTLENLGTFVEIEAIDKDMDIGKEKLLEQCNHFVKLFGIEEKDLIADSYSDILLAKYQ